MVYLKILTAVITLYALPINGTASNARLKRQSDVSPQNGAVIDSIFNIPITAIKQTSAAVQAFSPENSGTIESVFQIPLSTLEAVGHLIKNTSPQRRRDIQEETNRRYQEKRDRFLQKQEEYKLQKLQRNELKKKKLQLKQERYFHHKDPLGLNALTNLLVGHHGILGGHGGLGNHGIHQGLGAIHGVYGNLGSYGSHGSHGSHGGHGGHGGHGNHGSHTYEVHEYIDEPAFTWPGWPSFGHIFGSQASSDTIENKIAPKSKRDKVDSYQSEDKLPENKVAPKEYKKYSKSIPRLDKTNKIILESDTSPVEHRSTANIFWPKD